MKPFLKGLILTTAPALLMTTTTPTLPAIYGEQVTAPDPIAKPPAAQPPGDATTQPANRPRDPNVVQPPVRPPGGGRGRRG